MIKHFEKKLPARKEELNELLALIEENLETAGCPMKSQTAVLVSIEEIFVNIASYAFPDDENGEAEFVLDIDDAARRVSLTLKDDGIPFNPLAAAAPDLSLSAEERRIGGLGIFMVKKMMDEVHYQYSGGFNITTMIKNF